MDERDRRDEPDPADAEALAALRGADPAADARAPEALRARVAAIPDADAGTGAPAPRPIRRSPWLVPAAAAAALVVGIGGGYLLGVRVQTAPAPASAERIPVSVGTEASPAPPVTLGGAGDNAAGADAAGAAEAADPAARADMSTDAAVSPWHFSNHRRFVVPSFEQAPGTADVYAMDGRVRYSADDAVRIAAALGLVGDAQADANGYGWTVGDPSAGGPTLSLYPSGGGDVSYSGGVVDPWSGCYDAISPRYDLENGDDTVWMRLEEEVQQCLRDTPMPTEQQAREALSTFLAATGVDETRTVITVMPDETSRVISASAARVVEGNTTQIASSVSVAAAGIMHASGATGALVSLGTYAIVSPDEAAARLNDPAFAPWYASSTSAEIRYAEPEEMPTEPPAVPGAGAPVPWGITEFEIASARLGLALMTSPLDERFLAPAYEFTDTQGNVWSVIALEESALDTAGGGGGGGWWGPMY